MLDQLLDGLQRSPKSSHVERSKRSIDAVYREPVGVGAAAQQQQRRLPGLVVAGEEQWRCLGRRGSGETRSPL